MIKTDQYKAFFELVNSSSNILILNSKPDGDSIGASIAANLLLKKFGKQATSLSPSNIPDYLGFLVYKGNIKVVEIEKEQLENFDLIITLDSSELKRVLNNKEVKFHPKAKFIFIDHHEASDGDLIKNNLNIIDSNSESTCGLLVDLLKQYKKETGSDLIDENIAFLLYAGIVADTDYFAYANVTKQTFRRAAYLLNYNFDKVQIIKIFRETLSLKAFYFIQKNIGKVVINEAKRYAYLKIKKADLTSDDNIVITNEATNYINRALIRIIDCVDFSFVMRESGEGKTSLAFRRHNNGNEIDLSQIAARFGGGGHKQAAGAQVEREIDKVEKEIVEYLDNLSEQAS
jgi:phosphoesterase RecJ-like protein